MAHDRLTPSPFQNGQQQFLNLYTVGETQVSVLFPPRADERDEFWRGFYAEKQALREVRPA